MSVTEFGTTAAGEPVQQVTISDGELSASFLTWGCITREIYLEGVDHSLVLGLESFADYERNGGPHLGAIAGRVANRIRGGRFQIDGVEYQAARNVDGITTLHGGNGGFGRSLWALVDHGPDYALFHIRHEDGEEGFPGAIEAFCQYRLVGNGLEIEMRARSDAPTLCNLADHSYYNLSGAERIDDHELWLASNRETPLGPDMTPTGETAPARVDFSQGGKIGERVVDVNYVLADAPQPEPKLAARLRAGGVKMEMETTAPGVQLYTSDNLQAGLPGMGGRVLGPRSGICLEAQLWPDAANHPAFPRAVLRPGEQWRQLTRLRFSRD